MALFWLSFADEDGFRGAAFVEAEDLIAAVRRAHLLGINPGGQVLGPAVPEDYDGYRVAYENRDRLIQKEQLCRLFPDATKVGDFEDEHGEVDLPDDDFADADPASLQAGPEPEGEGE